MRTKYAFVVWFPIIATIVVVTFLALAGMPTVQSGPGALTALGLIPNLVVLGLCVTGIILCIVYRPRPLVTSPVVAGATVSAYLLIAFTAFSSSSITGRDTIHVRVVDWSGHPIPGVAIRLATQQSFSLRGALSPRADAQLTTDANGTVSIAVSRDHTLHGLLNAETTGHREDYRFATFMRSPNPDGTFRVQHSWSDRNQKHANGNMHFHTSKTEPYTDMLTVYLPSPGGDDTDPYVSQ